jgi:YD repeat-containing protein
LGREGVRPELDAKDATVVWLRDVWLGVDARYTLSASGVKEEFVVASPEALVQPGVFTSTLSAEGVLVGDRRRAGGLVLDWNGDGRTAVDGDGDGPKVSIDPPVVVTAKGEVVADSHAVYAVDSVAELDAAVKGNVGRRDRLVGVAVDAGVLARLPVEAFPVSVDPSFTVIPASMGGSWASYNSAGNLSTGVNQWGLLGNWRIFGGDDYWRFNIQPGYQYLWTNIAANARVFSANLRLNTVEYPAAAAPVFDSQWSSFPTSGYDAYPRACHASAWSYAGAYPGWDLSKCNEGYFFGYSWTGSVIGAHPSSGYVDVTNMIRPWVAAHDANGVLGVSVDDWPGGYNFKATGPSLEIQWDTPSPAVGSMVPADGATLTSTTPTLSWGAVTDPDAGQSPEMYRAVLFAGPQSDLGVEPREQCLANRAIWSTQWQTATSAAVPEGVLQDGVTYYWTVASAGWTNPPYSTCAPMQRFKVDRRLGVSGPAPVESLGPVSVNLATGNVIVGAGSHSIPTVGGEIGLQFAYNSQAKPRNGLRGQYFRGVDPRSGVTGPLDFTGSFLARVDQSLDFNWDAGAPNGVELDYFTARWTGYVTVPAAGSYCFGTFADDGTRVWIDNTLVLDNWVNQSAADRPCSASVSFAAGETKSIRVEYYDATGAAQVQLKTYSPSPVAGVVPTSWLSTEVPVLGPGWTMSDGDVSVSGARNTGSGVTLTLGDGSTVEYKKSDTGAYVGPVGDGTVVRVDAVSNEISVLDDAGTSYRFDANGGLRSAVAAVDDTHPAATQMTWSGNTAKLTAMTDPVSGQSFTLRYGGDSACGAPPSGFQISAGLLCRVESWDGRATDLFYNQGRLERVVNPGGVRSEFTYDASNRLTSFTDATANDATDAGVRSDDASVTWQIAYSGDKATGVTAPAPTVGATRQSVTVSYDSAAVPGTPGVTRVTASGLSAPNGYTKKVAFDDSYRVVSRWDDNAQRSDITYDGTSDRVAYTDSNVGTAQAMRTSTIYDTSVVFNGLSRPVASYGPAPVGSFTGATPNVGAVVPTSLSGYDEGINGLSAAWWDDTPGGGETYSYPKRPAFRGAPKVHALLSGATSWSWGSGSPDAAIPADNFSGRLTGLINMATAGTYSFGVVADDGVKLTIDDRVVADKWYEPNTYYESPPLAWSAGWHRISIDVKEDAGVEVPRSDGHLA